MASGDEKLFTAGQEAVRLARRLTDRYLSAPTVMRTLALVPEDAALDGAAALALRPRLQALSDDARQQMTETLSQAVIRRRERRGVPHTSTGANRPELLRPVSAPVAEDSRPPRLQSKAQDLLLPELVRPFLRPALPQARAAKSLLRRWERDEAANMAPVAPREMPPPDEDRDLRKLTPGGVRARLTGQGGPGFVLEPGLRERLRPHLSFDPSIARLHRTPAAAEAARTLRAEAFTIGRDIFFGEGQYQPAGRAGLGLLAHELTHVGQQAGGAAVEMRFFTERGGDAMEEEAQQAAARVAVQEDHRTNESSRGLLGQDASPPEPAMAFALPQNRARPGSLREPSQTATEDSGAASGHPAAKTIRASEVADRVYDLMRDEVSQARARGVRGRKG